MTFVRYTIYTGYTSLCTKVEDSPEYWIYYSGLHSVQAELAEQFSSITIETPRVWDGQTVRTRIWHL